MADRDQGRWRHHDPSRTEANRSSNAIAGPSSQVAGTKRIFSAPTGDSSGYRNVARKWPPPSESSSRLLVVKSARKTSQEWNPPVNRKSVSFDPMLHPIPGGSQALVPPAARRDRMVSGRIVRKSFVESPRLQPGSANTSSNTPRRLSQVTHMTPTSPSTLVTKSAPSPGQWWQSEDEAATAKMKRAAKPGDQPVLGVDGVKRRTMVSSNARRPTKASSETRELTASANRRRTYLGPNMTLMVEGEDQGPEDVDMKGVGGIERGIVPTGRVMGQRAVKAARKLQPVESESSDDSDSSSDSESSSEEESEPEVSGSEPDDTAKDVEATLPSRSGSPLLAPLLGTSPIRPIAPAETVLQTNQSPSEELVAALESLSLSSLRMQKTKQMPFLLRNLRRGFRLRCRAIGVPTLPSGEDVDVRIVYVYTAREGAWETRMRSWRCPLCLLHDKFGTKAMLVKHLDWDHTEVRVQWTMDPGLPASSTWTLYLDIPNPDIDILNHNRSTTAIPQPGPFRSEETPTLDRGNSVSTSRPQTSPRETPFNKAKLRPPSPTPLPTSSRGRSTTQTATRTRTERHPTPPPQDDSLGPSARHPYLPAKSEYGGPTIYYSCRPGGERLYDLLGTLPMAPFGVLAWVVIDREEEIFESDDVKDEHKVMHALWARWIMLNRNKFIADFNSGMVAFVDEYWRMIHRAAGWSALRYFLLMMMANKYISGAEVANVLRHYEGLTGMKYWYDD